MNNPNCSRPSTLSLAVALALASHASISYAQQADSKPAQKVEGNTLRSAERALRMRQADDYQDWEAPVMHPVAR